MGSKAAVTAESTVVVVATVVVTVVVTAAATAEATVVGFLETKVATECPSVADTVLIEAAAALVDIELSKTLLQFSEQAKNSFPVKGRLFFCYPEVSI